MTNTNSSFSIAAFLPVFLISIALGIIMIVALWKLFTKTGRPGWASIVPVYNLWVLFELTGFPAWLAILALVPFVNFVVIILEIVALVKFVQLFGKGIGFGILTIFFPFVTLPILAFGKAQYQGPAAPQNSVEATAEPLSAAPSQTVTAQPSTNSSKEPEAQSQPGDQQPPTTPAQ
jgi:hypothetical protein